MKLSIVATLYQSCQYLPEFHRRASAAAKQLVGDDYEIVLVNDGSPDNSLEVVMQLADSDDHLVVVDLSRNFGHHKAMMAGLEHAAGDLIFLIDSDLEEEPEWLQGFFATMTDEAADVVYGRQQQRKGGRFERWSGAIYYSVFNWMANIDHPRNIVTARLMTRRYVDALVQYREREMVISCLWVITGFKQVDLAVSKHASSKTTYSLAKKIQHTINAITSFSEVPLAMIFYVGFVIFMVAIIYTVTLIFNRLFFSRPLDGWTSVMVSVWMLGGMVISFIGVIGAYLSKIFIETKQRPYVIVRGIYAKSRHHH
ncbi:glycosyltransferase family 2 protein [uncultured Thiodictyon sp.]|jgi:putative glycosyltransferase|uniref:glycosyltransferase family 2 protein n=1 Tax=uncultured Thiodictyon sp. TaxID=1846217 RepID=UPI0025F769D7|nr:glycosyltransferase family 2 protein [uncultured Thiodictyon sp.]